MGLAREPSELALAYHRGSRAWPATFGTTSMPEGFLEYGWIWGMAMSSSPDRKRCSGQRAALAKVMEVGKSEFVHGAEKPFMETEGDSEQVRRASARCRVWKGPNLLWLRS